MPLSGLRSSRLPAGRRPAAGVRRAVRFLSAVALVFPIPGCANLDEAVNPDAVLQLTATPPSVAADGFSTTTVVAELDPRTLERYRDVSFTTTLGRFVGGTSSQDTSLVVAADANGRAAATLRSGTLVGTAVVTAEIRDGTTVKVARSLSIPFERVPASNVLSLGLSAPEAPADGATRDERHRPHRRPAHQPESAPSSSRPPRAPSVRRAPNPHRSGPTTATLRRRGWSAPASPAPRS